VSEPGGPEVLGWGEVPDPVCGPGEVIVDVAATAVNRADIMQRQGFYPPPKGASEILGLECSGVISEVGEGVTGWSVGDEVCALLSGGGYAERVAVPAGQLLPVPAGVTVRDAAALPEVVCTVWSNVFMLAGLRPEETLLVHGGTSGIGTMASQLASNLGARVIVTAGSEEKLQRSRGLGADVAINYREQDFVEAVRAATDGHGADVILDNMGAKYLARNISALALNGRLVVIGMQGGTKAELDLGALMGKRAAVLATSLRARPREEKAAIVASVREHVWPLFESGAVRPVVDRVLPMADAADHDLRLALDIHEKAFTEHYGHVPRTFEKFREQFDEHGPDWSSLWIGEVDGQPAGLLIGTQQFAEEDNAGYVRIVGVLPEARGRGLAKALLQTYFAAAQEDGRTAVLLHVDQANVTNALGLYESVGMSSVLQIDAWAKHVTTTG
jgi:putative PIG3 family NAD(P)H quinone oxidoreductase